MSNFDTADQFAGLTRESKAIDISSADVDCTVIFSKPYARRIYIGTAGHVKLKRIGQSAFITYKNVAAGTYLDGQIIAVGQTFSGAASDLVVEC